MKICFLIFCFLLPVSLWAQSADSLRCNPRVADASVAEIGKYGRQEEAFAIAKSCLSSVGSGFWSATGGKVTGAADTAKGLYEFVSSPAEGMSKLAESMKQTYAALGEVYNQGWSFFSTLPPTMVTDLVCSIGGSMATESLLTLFTGGANSAAMAARLLKYLETIKVLSQLKALATRLGVSIVELFKSIEGLDAKAREKLSQLLGSKEGQKRVESLMVSCAVK